MGNSDTLKTAVNVGAAGIGAVGAAFAVKAADDNWNLVNTINDKVPVQKLADMCGDPSNKKSSAKRGPSRNLARTSYADGNPDKKNGSNVWIWTIGIVMVLAIVGVLVWFFVLSRDDDECDIEAAGMMPEQ